MDLNKQIIREKLTQFGVLQDVRKDVYSLGDVSLETLGIEDGLLA